MKKVISIVLVIMTLVGLMIPVFANADSTKWVNCANGKKLNVRETAGGKVMYRLPCGTQVTIQSSTSAPKGWAFIKAPGHAKGGYVMTKFLVSSKPGKYQITERDDSFVTVTPYKVSAKAINKKSDRSVGLRVSPNKSSRAIRRLTAGDTLQVIARGKTWSKVVDMTTGNTGFVANAYMVKQ
ncbi:MAG: SH3 domain-containing protein [Clostridiales bacterium]|nr:SH3 domain-containing protein [Clostridia bacterium]MCR4883716.1 SH3 domain-containing protein [Clostridiales bacterium]